MDWIIAGAAFLALFLFGLPFPLIVAAALAVGFLSSRGQSLDEKRARPAPVPLRGTLKIIATWLAIWLVPLAAVAFAFGPSHVLSQLAWFYSKLAVVTFGGAYAVLAYMAQEVVAGYGWLTPGEMLDALGLAE